MPNDPVEDFLRGVKGAAPVAADPVDDFLATAKPAAPAKVEAASHLGMTPAPRADKPPVLSGAFRLPGDRPPIDPWAEQVAASKTKSAAEDDAFPVNRETRAALLRERNVRDAERDGNAKWAGAMASGDGPDDSRSFARRFPNLKTQADADFALAQIAQNRRASRTAEEVADESARENIAKKSPVMRGVLNAGAKVATYARAATGNYFGGLIGNGERQESKYLDKLNAALEDADGWTKYLTATAEGLGAGSGIGVLARGVGIGKALTTYGAVATPGGVKERIGGAIEMRAFGKVAEFLTPSTHRMLARLPESLRGPVMAKGIDLADEFVGGMGSEVAIRAAKGEDITKEALVVSGFVNMAQVSLRKVATETPPSPGEHPGLAALRAEGPPPAPEAPTRPVEAPRAEVAPEATQPVAEPVAAPVEPEMAAWERAGAKDLAESEAPAAPREEVIQPEVGEPPPKSPETTPPGESPESVSIKNRLMNRDRVRRGLGEIKTEFKETFKEWGDEALDRVAENSRAAEAVVDKLAKSMQSPDKVESALLTIRRVDLNRDLLAADKKGLEATTPEARAEAKVEADAIIEKFAVLDEIGLRGGAEAGRNLVARKMEMANDYSLVKMENDLRREQGYKKLTPEESSRQMAETKRLHDELAKAVADRDTWKARVEEIEARKGKARAAPGPKAPEYGKANKVVTREAYEKAKAEVLAKLSQMNVGIDPTILAGLAKMGAYHIEAGARTFASWAAAMRDQLKENAAKAEPHLEAAWNEAHKQIKAATFVEVSTKVAAGLKAGKPLAEMKGAIDKIALHFEREGVKDRAELIDKVHEVLKGIDPTITRRDTQVALSGYGSVTRPSDDPAKVALREHKGETQQDLKLEDMAAGKAPLASGPQRQPPGDVLRELIKQVNDAKRRGGYGTPDPATSLRTAMDAVKTRLKHELVDLQRQIDAGKKDIAKRTALTYDAEATSLRAQRDALKEVYNSVFGKSELTPEQRTEIALKAIKKSNADLEARAAAGDVFPAERVSKTPETPELKALRAKRAALQERIKDIRDAATPRGKTADQMDAARAEAAKKAAESKIAADIRAVEKSIAEYERQIKTGDVFKARAEPSAVDPRVEALRVRRDALAEQAADMRAAATPRESWSQIAEQAREARLTKQAETLERRLETGQLEAPARRPAVPPTPEAIRLEARVDTLKRTIAERVFQARLANRTKLQKTGAAVLETATTARALMTSLDFSAVLRQGGFIALGHPIRAARAMGAMFKAAWSKDGQARIEAEIRLRPTYGLAKRSGLYLSEHGHTPYSKMEEAYMSRWADKVPGIAGSQRAYTTFLNRIRMDSFDVMVSKLSHGLTPTPKEAQAIANYVNVATGRGGAKDSQLLAGLNTVFFSPRLVASRFQLLLRPLSGFRQGGETSAKVRWMVAKEYGRFLAGIAAVYGLGMLAGGEIEGDVNHYDFGKIKFGETRVDGLAGLAQVTRFTGDTVRAFVGSINGDRREKAVAARYPIRTWNFERTKFAPILSAYFSGVSGKTPGGDKTTWGKEGLSLVTPMSGRELVEAIKEEGLGERAALNLLSFFGMSVQTHEKRRGK